MLGLCSSSYRLTALYLFLARKILGQDEDNYDFRTIDMKSPEVSYDAFKNGRGKSPWAPRYESMQDLAIITRGNHKAGDKLLDWLVSIYIS